MNLIRYINPAIPRVALPTRAGERREAIVPATLDLQERCALAVHALTEPTDPEADHEIYWRVSFLRNPPIMSHAWDDHVQVKFMEALPLLRLASGSEQNLQVEQRWMEMMLQMQGPDGLLYWPKTGRPWAKIGFPEAAGDQYTIPYDVGRLIGAMTIYRLLTGEDMWKEAAERAVQGLASLAVDRGMDAYFSKLQYEPGERADPGLPLPAPYEATWAAWVIMGLAQFFRATGYEPAARLATKLSRFLQTASGVFGPNGEFEGFTHFHHHTYPLLAMLELGLATDDREWIEFARRGYDFAKTPPDMRHWDSRGQPQDWTGPLRIGEPLVGYFPEHFHTPHHQTTETCQVADMIALAIKLGEWDDADRWARNQFVENQLTRLDWIERETKDLPHATVDASCQTAERVAGRNLGAFAGWPSANDWQGQEHSAIMHCCTGNGARTLYYIWENILRFNAGHLQVNLLLNRASPWADVDSHIPYSGQVDVKVKQPCRLSVRVPEWVALREARCQVNGSDRRLAWDGRVAQVGEVGANDTVTLTFPIPMETEKATIEKRTYTLVRKGHEVIGIDPPGKNCPLYQRAHYLENTTRWKKVARFVANRLVGW